MTEQVGKEGADSCQQEWLHLKKKNIFEMPEFIFQKLIDQDDYDDDHDDQDDYDDHDPGLQ